MKRVELDVAFTSIIWLSCFKSIVFLIIFIKCLFIDPHSLSRYENIVED